jgi:uncharacterized membrane protein (DUF373 family)
VVPVSDLHVFFAFFQIEGLWFGIALCQTVMLPQLIYMLSTGMMAITLTTSPFLVFCLLIDLFVTLVPSLHKRCFRSDK